MIHLKKKKYIYIYIYINLTQKINNIFVEINEIKNTCRNLFKKLTILNVLLFIYYNPLYNIYIYIYIPTCHMNIRLVYNKSGFNYII